jgi:5-methyltetrahydrofolate--homocysteine methyltransferase
MTKAEFQELAQKQLLYLDGATGSNLIKSGMPAGVCPEIWILEHPQVMIDLQMAYIEAGTNIIYSPTFTSNRIKMEEYGLEKNICEINHKLVALSREAIDKCKEKNPNIDAFVAGDITMTGKQLQPMGTLSFERLIEVYKEQIQYLVVAGVDLLVVETMMSLQECRAALIAAKETCDLPVMVTMTFEADGRSLYGTDAATAIAVLQSLGAVAVGTNCSTGPDKMIDTIREMVKYATVPIIAKPNAGMPKMANDGTTYYDMSCDEFAAEMIGIVEAGASLIGGCCGTSPSYIKALYDTTHTLKITDKNNNRAPYRFLASERKVVRFDLDSPFIIVGERINPTGKKALQEQLRNDCFDLVNEFAEQQEAQGATVLDVNLGMSGIDEKEVMLKAIDEITQTVSLPLSIDTSHIDVMEAALRRYPGRALINSISLEKVKFDSLLPIAAKYGAMFILLPLSDDGLPKDLEEKKRIIHQILDRALELGMKKEDIVVDGLVQTVGANRMAGIETLETIQYCKETLGLATIVGLSNISFGLPERTNINSSFLSLAIRAGLTMAISNPSQQLLISNALAADLLLNKEGADIRYIEYINNLKEQNPGMAPMGSIAYPKGTDRGQSTSENRADKNTVENSKDSLSVEELIHQAVLKGRQKAVVDLTKSALSSGMEASAILNDILMPAINEVGDLFEKGKYFLPQLIASAETMKAAIEYLEPILAIKKDGKEMPTIIIATVKGDIHDIGKNLVALMLKNYGFKVIDLGKDVAKESIIQSAKDNNAQIIALSALMTTTMLEMKYVVAYAKEQGVSARIMIGGAVITQEYADEIGADGYSKDAAEAVKVAQRILEML